MPHEPMRTATETSPADHRLPASRPFTPTPPGQAAAVQATQKRRPAGTGHRFGRVRVERPGGFEPAATAQSIQGTTPIQLTKSPPKSGKVSRKRALLKTPSGGMRKKRRSKYRLGQHGFKTTEQRRLKQLLARTVSGRTHQSEHPIGFEVINRTSGLRRGGRGLPTTQRERVRNLENFAPAYQEQYQLHRDHIGTGSRGTVGRHGWNAQSYRDDQRTALESGDPALAVQLNQLGYAFDPNFQSSTGTAKDQADASYQTMVQNFPGFSYAQGSQNVQVGVTQKQKAEMHLARGAARSGNFPSKQQENQVRKLYGLPELED